MHNGKLVEVLGTDGISPLDGRLGNYKAMLEGYRRYISMRFVGDYFIGFRIYKKGSMIFERVFKETLKEYYERREG